MVGKVKYVELKDAENPKDPKGENIALELQIEIEKVKREHDLELVTFTFLGEKEVLDEEEDSLFQHAIAHDKVWKFMLYFS